jgi:hypothetical protein
LPANKGSGGQPVVAPDAPPPKVSFVRITPSLW